MKSYYSSLSGHREEFQTGWPILMYHKLGQPPAGSKMRGLYVSADRFRRQLAEFSTQGIPNRNLDDPVGTPGVTITFDDGFTSVLQSCLEPLHDYQFTAIQYLVPGLLGRTNTWDLARGEIQEPLMDAVQVREWLAAGQQIGAHTMSHPRLTELPLGEAREEITASRKALEDTFGVPIRHFAYPFGDYNPAIRDLVQEAGFLTATTTEAGVNSPDQPRLELKRYMARHPSRKLLQPWTWRGD